MQRILFITSNRIGDAILSTGVLEAAMRAHPEAKVTIVCGPLAAPLFRGIANVEEIIPIEKRPGRWRALWGKLRGRRWDLAIDLRGSLVTQFLRARRRIVHRKDKTPRHKVEELSALMGAPEPLAPVVRLDAKARFDAADYTPPKRRIVALGPGSNFIGKRWAPERFAELGRRLAGLGGAGPLRGALIVILGGPEDAGIGEDIRTALSAGFCDVLDASGKLDLLAAAAVLERASLFIGNDSGLMHLAAAMGAPTLGLFGPSDERIYGPWGPRARALRGPRSYREILAAVGYFPNVTTSLMDELEVDPVEAAAIALLKETTA